MNARAMTKPRTSLFAACALALLSACNGAPTPADQPPLAGAAIGGPFELTDKDGKTVRWSDFAGHYRIVYFGYTFCPDACPTDVAVAMRGLDLYAKTHGPQADALRPIFITIDPARDTPKVVGQFAAAFSPRLIGLTGTPAQIAQAAKAFAAYYARGKDSAGGYLMDHSRIAYLMAPNGDPITMLPLDKGPQAVAEELTKWVR
jgi:protein SCO1/2